jgi:hypothetical protein
MPCKPSEARNSAAFTTSHADLMRPRGGTEANFITGVTLPVDGAALVGGSADY